MNSTLSKVSKIFLSVLLCLCMIVPLAACSGSTDEIEYISQIVVKGAVQDSWMYSFADKDFIDDMVDFYNNISYEDTDKSVNASTIGEVYSFIFYDGVEEQARLTIDKNNIIAFELGKESYALVSDFKYDQVKELVENQIEEYKSK